jgi:hypothetical protein
VADHLPAGGIGDAEVAIEEEVAQSPFPELGVAGFDVGEFADDEASTVFVREIATCARRPNFRQRRVVAVTASCCHAKITPAALHCGDLAAAPSNVGIEPESGFARIGPGSGGRSGWPVHVRHGMGIKQNLPVD